MTAERLIRSGMCAEHIMADRTPFEMRKMPMCAIRFFSYARRDAAFILFQEVEHLMMPRPVYFPLRPSFSKKLTYALV